MQKSPQFKDGKFVNPTEAPLMAEGSTWKYIKKSWFSKREDPEPAEKLPVIPIQTNDWKNVDKDAVSFAWLGHSSILVAVDGKTILMDPVLEKRASPLSWIGPKRFHPPPITVGDLPPIDVVLITHDHYDHLEKPTMIALQDKAGLFLVPLGIGELLEDWGIAPEKVVELDWWEQHVVGQLTFTATPGMHYARRGLFDGDERLWCSWAIQTPSRSIFFAGDTGYSPVIFKGIGQTFKSFDIAIVPIGAYDPARVMQPVHTNPEEAIQMANDVNADLIIPSHWGTITLTDEPPWEPIERYRAFALKNGISDGRACIMKIGETRVI